MCPDNLKRVCLYAQNLAKPPCVFVANLKIDAIYVFYPESFCDKNLAVRKVFAFSDSAVSVPRGKITSTLFPTTRKPIADSLGLIQKEVGRGRDVLSIRPKSCRQFSCGGEVGRN